MKIFQATMNSLKMPISATEGELITQIGNVRGEQEHLNMKLTRILEEAISKPLEEKAVFIAEMKEIQTKISESMDLMRSLQDGLEDIMKAREESSKGDPISAAICAIKSGQKLKFNPAKDNMDIIPGGDILEPKMEADLVSNSINEVLPESNQESDHALDGFLLEEQFDDLQYDRAMVDNNLPMQVGDEGGQVRSITDEEIRSIIERTDIKVGMVYKGECQKCHMQFANSNSLGGHMRETDGNCLRQACKSNHNHDYIVKKFDTEDHVQNFIGMGLRKC